MSTFLDGVTRLLETHVAAGAYAIVNNEDYPEYGTGVVEVSLEQIRLRFVKEKDVDFWIDVSSHHEPPRYFGARELLLLISGEPAVRSQVVVGHDLVDLGNVLRSLSEHQSSVAMRLDPTRLPDTLAQLAQIRRLVMHPVLQQALKRDG